MGVQGEGGRVTTSITTTAQYYVLVLPPTVPSADTFCSYLLWENCHGAINSTSSASIVRPQPLYMIKV